MSNDAAFPDHLHPALMSELERRGFTTPTPVQAAVLDPAQRGRDLLVSSQTGSGKTVAFGLAAADALVAGDAAQADAVTARQPRVLVVAPTRELALQVQRELGWLYAGLGARVAACVGGTDVGRERRALMAGAHVVVGTPGRLADHVRTAALDLSRVGAVVLDEADEMLDMGFRDEIVALLAAAPVERRTLMFSATIPRAIADLARAFQKDASRIVASGDEAHQDIEVRAHLVHQDERLAAIVNLLRFHDPACALVFVAFRESVTACHELLLERGFQAVALSGEMSQPERTRALQALRDGRARVLVATDVAARGLDLPDVSLVIHADLAADPTMVTHRNGRTGRAGRKGIAVLLASPRGQRMAETQLRLLGSATTWSPLPGAGDVRAADVRRTLARSALPAEARPEDDALAEALLAAHSPEALARMLAGALRSALPEPESVALSLELRPWKPAAAPRPAYGQRRPQTVPAVAAGSRSAPQGRRRSS